MSLLSKTQSSGAVIGELNPAPLRGGIDWWLCRLPLHPAYQLVDLRAPSLFPTLLHSISDRVIHSPTVSKCHTVP